MWKRAKSGFSVPKYKYKWKCQQKGAVISSVTDRDWKGTLTKEDYSGSMFCGFDSTESPVFVSTKFTMLQYLQSAS